MRCEVTPTSTDRLYHDLYTYSSCLRIPGASALRNWRQGTLQQAQNDVVKRWNWRAWRAQLIYGGNKLLNNQGGSWRPSDLDVVRGNQDLELIQSLLGRLRQHQQDIKVQVSHDMLYIYCNDLDIVDFLGDSAGVTLCWTKQAMVDRPRDVVLLRTVNHSRRSFLRERWLSVEHTENLTNFLRNQTEIRLSPGMQKFLKMPQRLTKGMYVPSGWFIDHDDNGEIFMLEMVVPRLIRKTVEIRQR